MNEKLERMRDKLPRERETGGYGRNSNIIEYSYANYDVEQAQIDYQAVAEELARAQNALDQVNSTVEF